MRFEQWPAVAVLTLSPIMTSAAAATAAADVVSDVEARKLAAQNPLRGMTGFNVVEAKPAAAYVIATADGKASISIDTAAAPDLREWARTKLAPTLALWYPRIAELLDSDGFVAPIHVNMTFRPQPGVAETLGTEVSGNSDWFRKQLEGEAVGAMVHELVHVVQQYGDREPETFPGWLTEGIADYIRFFVFEPNYHGADDIWLAKQDLSKVRFDGAYRQTANFLDWVTRKYDPRIVEKLNAAARRGDYNEAIWREQGKSVGELGEEWKTEKVLMVKSGRG